MKVHNHTRELSENIYLYRTGTWLYHHSIFLGKPSRRIAYDFCMFSSQTSNPTWRIESCTINMSLGNLSRNNRYAVLSHPRSSITTLYNELLIKLYAPNLILFHHQIFPFHQYCSSSTYHSTYHAWDPLNFQNHCYKLLWACRLTKNKSSGHDIVVFGSNKRH